LGIRTIGVQFDQESPSFDSPDQPGKIWVEGRFSSRETDTVNPALERTKTIQDLFQRDRKILLRMGNETMIMTVGTAKVAPREKDHRADLSGPVDEGGL